MYLKVFVYVFYLSAPFFKNLGDISGDFVKENYWLWLGPGEKK